MDKFEKEFYNEIIYQNIGEITQDEIKASLDKSGAFAEMLTPYWLYYYKWKNDGLHINNVLGKWMIFGTCAITEKARKELVEKEICPIVKIPNPEKKKVGVTCFYCTKDKIIECAEILLRYNLIKRTKSGAYQSIAFKYEEQTKNNEYNKDFKAKLSLGDLFDLATGELKENIDINLFSN